MAQTPEDLKAAHARLVEQVRANPQLSDEGRRRQIARSYLSTSEAIDGLRIQLEQANEAERKRLEKRFVGPSPLPLGATTADSIARDASFRDALERASATPPGDGKLGEIMQRATMVGDTLLARAALTVAIERSDVPAVNVWLADHPADDAPMNRLFALAEESSTSAAFHRALEFSKPDKPRELVGLSQDQIAEAATAA